MTHFLRRPALLALFLAASGARAVTYVTYAAWPDPSNACSGYLHLFTTVPNTTFTLYESNSALSTINSITDKLFGVVVKLIGVASC